MVRNLISCLIILVISVNGLIVYQDHFGGGWDMTENVVFKAIFLIVYLSIMSSAQLRVLCWWGWRRGFCYLDQRIFMCSGFLLNCDCNCRSKAVYFLFSLCLSDRVCKSERPLSLCMLFNLWGLLIN